MTIKAFTSRLQNLYADQISDLQTYAGAGLGYRAIVGPTGPNYVAVPTGVTPTGSYCLTGVGVNWLLLSATGPQGVQGVTGPQGVQGVTGPIQDLTDLTNAINNIASPIDFLVDISGIFLVDGSGIYMTGS
jgi:hypothetical protein